MIDPADKQTASLHLEQPKRGRGRPVTGEALTPAQKQKAYRERLKSNVTKNVQDDSQISFLSRLLDQERENTERLANKVLELERQLKEMKKDNVTESKGRLSEGMQRIIQDVHDVADALEGSTWRIQRKARANGKWLTQKGSYWNEARAEDALAEIPNKKGGWWRIIEVKSEVED